MDSQCCLPVSRELSNLQYDLYGAGNTVIRGSCSVRMSKFVVCKIREVIHVDSSASFLHFLASAMHAYIDSNLENLCWIAHRQSGRVVKAIDSNALSICDIYWVRPHRFKSCKLTLSIKLYAVF